jgi:hypothetical protein
MTITVQYLYPLKSSSAVPNMTSLQRAWMLSVVLSYQRAFLRTEGQITPLRKRAIEMPGTASYYN